MYVRAAGKCPDERPTDSDIPTKRLPSTTTTVGGVVQPSVNVNAISPANALFLTQNALAGLLGGATTEAQFQNAVSPVLNIPTSFFPVFTPADTSEFASGFNSMNANFAAMFAFFFGN
jgi:hypothetical protein